ncbi:MAG TPA: GTP 3',8-cyclase MoaA [Burkholderiaceae bacterium]|nr:GTP 3',8-cyclase MoaA [Burkholderiaceae bacterium]
MTERIIPITDLRRAPVPEVPAPSENDGVALRDQHGRPMRDLRISVTDRCNFRCTYCMPKEVFDKDYAFLPHEQLLSFEEITRLARVFIAQGVEKLRLTGGEPLLRRHLERLITMLAELRLPDGRAADLTLTTNGALLARKARALADAGLKRVTVSLDGLDDMVFRAMNDVDFPVTQVLQGIDAAADAGLGPIKINMVVKRGVNDSQILPMVRRFRGTGHVLRFIEFMDVGATNGWRLDDVLPSADVIARIHEHFPLEPLEAHYAGEVAQRWRFVDGAGEIGVISSVTQAFCRDCTRARLSTDGKLFLCLFGAVGHDLRALMRQVGADDDGLARVIASIWRARADRYSELRSAATPGRPKIEMSYIGG